MKYKNPVISGFHPDPSICMTSLGPNLNENLVPILKGPEVSGLFLASFPFHTKVKFLNRTNIGMFSVK